MFTRDYTALSSTDRTAATTATFDAGGAVGLHLIINVTSNASTVTITPTLQALTTHAGSTSDYYNIYTASGITSTGATIVKIGPHLTTATNVQGDYVPENCKLSVAHGSTDSIQYSVGVKKFYPSNTW